MKKEYKVINSQLLKELIEKKVVTFAKSNGSLVDRLINKDTLELESDNIGYNINLFLGYD